MATIKVEAIPSSTNVSVTDGNNLNVSVETGNDITLVVTPTPTQTIQISRGVAGATGQGVPMGGTTGQSLVKASNANYDTEWSDAGTGDVTGAASSVNNDFAAFNGTTGKIIKDSGYSAASFATAAQGAKADTAVQPSSLATVATTGSYTDLINKPTIPAAQVNSDWNATSGVAQILNKPTLGSAAYANTTDFATAAQGVEADTALQSVTSADGSIIVLKTGTNIDLAVSNASPASTLVVYARNQTGATLTKGTVVYLNSATGQTPTLAKAQANAESTSSQTQGLVTADIANNGFGYVTAFGILADIDTSGFTDGQAIYLSPTVAGGFTSTKPKAPNHLVYLGMVSYAHAIHGKIQVKVQNGYELDEIHDVLITSPADGQTLLYDNANKLWKNANLSAGTGISVTNGAASATITNTAPDQTVVLNAGTNVTITGTYPNFTINATGGGGGSGTVTSVALSLPSELTVTGSPITTSGTLAGAWANQTTNKVFAAPNGSTGLPSFRALVSADIPALSYVSSVSGTGVISSTGGLTPTISISQATTSTSGYLSSTDWNTFNNKQPAGSYLTTVTVDAPLSGSGTSASHLSIPAATTSANGYLTSTDWNTFNSKGTVSSVGITAGTGINVTGSPITGSGSITVTNSAPDQVVALTGAGTVTVTGTYPSFTITGAAGAGVTAVTASTPLASTGGATPNLTLSQSTTSTDGYLSSTDWNTFNGKAPATSGTSILYGNGSGGFSNVTIGSGLSFATGTLSATGGGTGTVTSVSGTGTVSGISLSGTVTSSGSLTLGGSLDLSAPPAIGGTTPNTGKFTSITSTQNIFNGYTNVTSAGGTTVLTATSTQWQKISGSTTQTFTLPDATTLPLGASYIFDNDSTGVVTVNDNASGLIDNISAGVLDFIFLEDNSTAAGVWGKYSWIPASYNFSNSIADFGSATLVSGTSNFLPNYYYRKNTATTLSSATGNQSIFALTSGVTVAANTIYEVECEFELTTTGTTSHTESFGFTLATATVTNMGVAVDRLVLSTTAASSNAEGIYLTSVTPTVSSSTITTAQNVLYRVKGSIAFGTGGSINPVIAFSAAPGGTSTIVLGSWMKMTPIGTTGSNVSIGTWA